MGPRAATTFVCLVLLFLSGCGDEASLPKAQFLRQANSICERATERRAERMAAVLEEAPPAKSELISTQVEAQLAAVEVYETATSALEKLDPPGGDGEEVDRFVTTREDAAKEVREAPATAYFSNYPYRRANEVSDRYGLPKCHTGN
jgi:hypothetical protein